MKNFNSAIRKIALCLGFLVIMCVPVKSYAAKYFEVTTRVKNKTAVEIGWAEKSVSGYEIYRSECDRYGDAIRYQRIAEVSGKKTKYVDKTVQYKKQYKYKVKAYKKKGSKKSYKFEGEAEADVTMVAPWWDDYLYCDGVTTPTSIELAGYSDGIEADAFEVYRKEGTGKYKRISIVKAKGKQCRYFKYEDKAVKKGKTYA
ncbi:MAG: hypothetical protein K2K56_03645, partial [Lachnospiraceae bacterium]|nr:hypothetical protein [Lachnospiraceae bacterium]